MTVVTTVSPLSRPRAAMWRAADGQRVVAVADLAGLVDRDQPVAVAVEGEAELAPAAQHAPSAAPPDAAPRTPRLMLSPSGLRAQHDHAAPRRRKTVGRHPVGRAVRAVEHDGHAARDRTGSVARACAT